MPRPRSHSRHTPARGKLGAEASTGVRSWEEIVLIYAGQQMADDVALGDYHVPPVRADGSWLRADAAAGRRAQR